MKLYKANSQELLLVKERDEVFAFGTKCTHYGAPLEKGFFSEGPFARLAILLPRIKHHPSAAHSHIPSPVRRRVHHISPLQNAHCLDPACVVPSSDPLSI